MPEGSQLFRPWPPTRFGMAGFTMIMGNAFAAFPVMTAGDRPAAARSSAIGGDPADGRCAIGMLSGLLRDAADPHGGELQHRARPRCWS
jgi:hypothetical protein